MKTSQILELEGTWEEILAYADKLANRRVRLIILPDEPESKQQQSEQQQTQPSFRPASGKSPLRHVGTWAGDDFEECLKLVYDTRGKIEL